MLCYSHARTGNAARAVGVAVNDAASWSASKARTRSSIASGEICQLCLGKSVPLGEELADFRISFLDVLLSDILHESLLVDPKRHHLWSEIAWHFAGGLPISTERSG